MNTRVVVALRDGRHRVFDHAVIRAEHGLVVVVQELHGPILQSPGIETAVYAADEVKSAALMTMDGKELK